MGQKEYPIKYKNTCWQTLIVRTIDQVKKLKEVNSIIVSTDSKKIASIALNAGAEVPFIRPKSYKDNSSEWLVWRHALNSLIN